ncbi:hypothetical protein IAR55_004162 [Kwoniella newhampshirensis]|uniref:G-protein coupled receptors family 1 profile domain-containing protein n=1 Tax=Kwoniella newhampshirensis TaxID=1651941 RepID=A0AAW0Z1A6_9TREE
MEDGSSVEDLQGIRKHYGLTDHQVWIADVISCSGSIGSLIVCTFVILSAGWVWSHRSCRHIIDRVSFRLLLCNMFFEIWYSSTFLCLYITPSLYDVGGIFGARGCTSGVYFLVGTMGVANYLCTFIAINLMLTICFGIDPIQRRLEKWYIIISIFLGYAIPIPSAALRHFGWDKELKECWISSDIIRKRVRDLILGIYLWQLLSCVVSAACIGATLVVLFRQGRATARALMAGSDLNKIVVEPDPTWPQTTADKTSSGDLDEDLSLSGSEHDEEDGSVGSPALVPTLRHHRYIPFTYSSVAKRIRNHQHARELRQARRMSRNSLSDKFLGIAMRISFYPLMLIAVNLSMTIGDLYVSSSGGVVDSRTYALFCFTQFLYGGRGMFYGVLAIAVDPCLVRGMKAAWREHRLEESPGLPLTDVKVPAPVWPLSLRDSHQPIAKAGGTSSEAACDPTQRSRLNSAVSIDLFGALAEPPTPFNDNVNEQFSLEVTIDQTSAPAPAPTIAPLSPSSVDLSRQWTQTFQGVPVGVLPEGLTDESDFAKSRSKPRGRWGWKGLGNGSASVRSESRVDEAESKGIPVSRKDRIGSTPSARSERESQNPVESQRQRTRQERRIAARKIFDQVQGRL